VSARLQDRQQPVNGCFGPIPLALCKIIECWFRYWIFLIQLLNRLHIHLTVRFARHFLYLPNKDFLSVNASDLSTHERLSTAKRLYIDESDLILTGSQLRQAVNRRAGVLIRIVDSEPRKLSTCRAMRFNC
jgi:hypothetical protein